MATENEQMTLSTDEQEELRSLTAECLDEKGKPKKGMDFKKLKRLKELSQRPKAKYAFPTKSRCPRCESTDTKAVSTQGNVQYRECQRAICRWKYTVMGEKV